MQAVQSLCNILNVITVIHSHLCDMNTVNFLYCPITLCYMHPAYLVKTNDWLRMNTNDLQTPTVSLKQLGKQMQEDSSDFFILAEDIEQVRRHETSFRE